MLVTQILTLTIAAWVAAMDNDLSRADFTAYYLQVVPQAFGSDDTLRARCPIHDGGSNSSFAIDLKTGLWYCHSTCGRGGNAFKLHMLLNGITDFHEARKAVYEMIGRPLPPYKGPAAPKPLTEYRQALTPWRTTATYTYEDESGQVLYRAVRKEKIAVGDAKPEKKFSLETPREGGWNSAAGNMEGIRRVPYRLPQLIEARNAGECIWLAEGEKASESLIKLRLPATCNPQGAGKWSKYRHDLNPHFAGARVVILPDNDDVGRKHALSVADNLLSLASQVKILELPDLPDKGDVVDWLATGGDRETLLRLETATPPLDAQLFAAYKQQWAAPKPREITRQAETTDSAEPEPHSLSERSPDEAYGANEEPHSTEAEEAVRKELTRLLQARVLRFVQIGKEVPSFRLETGKGSIRFEHFGQIATQRDFRRITAPVLNHSVAHHKDPEWIALCNLLLSVKTMEQADPEAEPIGSTKTWLIDYLQSNTCHASWADALKTHDPDSRRLPHFEGPRICISADHARNWSTKHRNEVISYNRLAEVLSDIGSTRITRSTHVPKTNITFYRLPAEFLATDYQLDLTSDLALDSIDRSHIV